MREGLWIPNEVLADETLSGNQKLILAEIIGWEVSGKVAFVSNTYLSKLCGCSTRTVQRILRDLEHSAHLLVEPSRNGEKRQIRLSSERQYDYGKRQSDTGMRQSDNSHGHSVLYPDVKMTTYNNRNKNRYKNTYNESGNKTSRMLKELEEYANRHSD
jgi:hypothetical protein